jgi:hypothetical protein
VVDRFVSPEVPMIICVSLQHEILHFLEAWLGFHQALPLHLGGFIKNCPFLEETYGILLRSFIHSLPRGGCPFLGLHMAAHKIIQLVDLLKHALQQLGN